MKWTIARLPRPLLVSVTGIAIGVFALFVRPIKADETDTWSHTALVPITMTSYQFAPTHFELQRGKTYRLHLVNASGKGHNFSAPGLFASSTIAPQDRAKISDGAVEVDSGSSVDVAFIPLTPGDYPINCTHFLHTMLGMRATVSVN